MRYAGETYDGIVLVGGFSKAYSSLLAFIACPTEVKQLLKVAAPPYLYSGPSPVASLATVLAGFDVNERRGDELRADAPRAHGACSGRARPARHRDAQPLGTADHRDPAARPRRASTQVGRFLFERGVYVTLAAYPLVPKDEVGFRVQLTAANTVEEVDQLIAALEELAERGELRSARAAAARGRRMSPARGLAPAGRSRGSSTSPPARSPACSTSVSPPLKGSGPLMNLLGLSPVLAILFGVRLHQPASRLPWYLLAAGSALFWLGDLYTYSYPLLLGADVPFPSPGDALYVPMYPVMMAGPAAARAAAQRAARDRSGLIDGLILTVGLSLPAWIALMAPYLHHDDLSHARQARLGRLPGRRRHPRSARSCASRSTPAAASRRSTC